MKGKTHVKTFLIKSFVILALNKIKCIRILLFTQVPSEIPKLCNQFCDLNKYVSLVKMTKLLSLLMHLEYRVTLPDHDWVVADRHKLIPSVYWKIVIEPEYDGEPEAVTYSGATHVAIHSGEKFSTSARTHSSDLARLLELEIFEPIIRISDRAAEQMTIFTIDCGQDENTRYP